MSITRSQIFLLLMEGFIIGLFAQGFFEFDPRLLARAGILLALVGLIAWQRLVWVAVFAGLFIFAGFAYSHWRLEALRPNNLPFGQTVKIEGFVASEPEPKDDKTNLIIKVPAWQTKILVTTTPYPQYQYGQNLEISGVLEQPKASKTFNYPLYLAAKGIFAEVKNPEKIAVAGGQGGLRIMRYLLLVKTRFEDSINRLLPQPAAGFLAGLLLGARQNIPKYLIDAFNRTGTTHIIAISGFNITIISEILRRYLNAYLPRKVAIVFCGILMLGFVLLTGASASVVRAGAMAGVLLLAAFIGRQRHLLIAITLTALLMLLPNPLILRSDLGFQLSFLAVLGLIYLVPHFDRWLKWLPKLFREPASATFSAQIFTLPVLLSSFGRVSLAAPLANILILPLVPTVMGIGGLAAGLGMAWFWLGTPLGWFGWVMLQYIIVVVEQLSKIPWAAVDFHLPVWGTAVYYLGLVGVIWKLQKYALKQKI